MQAELSATKWTSRQQSDGAKLNCMELNRTRSLEYAGITEQSGTLLNTSHRFPKAHLTIFSQAAARHTVDPANAILNYAYAMLEGQTRQALSATRFDLACGFVHAARRGRDALACDPIELALRAVDECVLRFYAPTRVPKPCVQ